MKFKVASSLGNFRENLFADENSQGKVLEKYRTIYGEAGELLGVRVMMTSLKRMRWCQSVCRMIAWQNFVLYLKFAVPQAICLQFS